MKIALVDVHTAAFHDSQRWAVIVLHAHANLLALVAIPLKRPGSQASRTALAVEGMPLRRLSLMPGK
ncbi:MAG: hypothetical protein WBX49_02265 [Candidatus Deferrimicrobiaceae bacterium]